MKSPSLALLPLLLAAPLSVYDGDQIIPAGSLVQCTLSEPKLNSKTTAIGDPVLCHLGFSERYGRSVLPYNSYLVGRFEDYKDPGHFVGKGWMELKFDRIIVEPDTVIPINARVVDVPGYVVDRQGRILGKGHAVRDTIEWMIPILWPIDLINLPRRGPRPTLREETRLTLKVMDDLEVPQVDQPQRDPNGLMHRMPSDYQEPAPAPPPPDQSAYQQDQQPADQYPPDQAYDAPPPPPAPYYAAPVPAPVVVAPYYYGYAAPRAYAYGFVGGYGYGVRPYGYGARPYAARPGGYGYGARPYAARPGGYGYGARAFGGGYGAGRAAMASRGGYGGGYRGGGAGRGR
jgi:hypothetical protein